MNKQYIDNIFILLIILFSVWLIGVHPLIFAIILVIGMVLALHNKI